MKCMKCGRDVTESDIFCADCLAEMDRYPVNPGTKVHIPVRPEPVERKPVRPKKERTPEEQIALLHKLVRGLAIATVSLTAALILTLFALFYTITGTTDSGDTTPKSRNYTTTSTIDGE